MGYAYKIEKDYIAGIGSSDQTSKVRYTAGCKDLATPNRFKLYDDDGELYYIGTFGNTEGDVSPSLGEDAFAPLDWAQSYAGCTRIDYLNPQNGRWETL